MILSRAYARRAGRERRPEYMRFWLTTMLIQEVCYETLHLLTVLLTEACLAG